MPFGKATAPPAPSPVAGVFAKHAQSTGGKAKAGPKTQSAGAPMPLNAGGSPAAKFGHAATVMP